MLADMAMDFDENGLHGAQEDAFTLAWEDYFDLPQSSTALVPTEGQKTHPDEVEIEVLIDKLLKHRREGISSESVMSHSHEPSGNNRLELMIDGHRTYPQIFDTIKNAKSHVHISYYKYMSDGIGTRFTEVLIEKAKEGVQVRFMLDSLGSDASKDEAQAMLNKMREAGVEVIENHVLWTSSSKDEGYIFPRDHRKIVVVDSEIAFTGGMNVADIYRSEFHDTMIRMRGDIVHQIQIEWMFGWINQGGKIDEHRDDDDFIDHYFPNLENFPGFTHVKLAQGHPGHNDEIRREYLKLIKGAEEKINLQVPYFSMEEVYLELINAAKRGVEVNVIIPQKNDSKTLQYLTSTWYPDLLKAGCKIYEYPGFTHLKGMTVDSHKTIWGSSNLDTISFHLNREMNVIVDNPLFTEMIDKEIFEADIKKAKRVTEAEHNIIDTILGGVLNTLSNLPGKIWGQ